MASEKGSSPVAQPALQMLSADEAAAATKESIPSRPKARAAVRAPYFADLVREELERLYSRDVLTSEGLRIFTSLDVEAQRATEEALRSGLADLDRRSPKAPEPLPPVRAQMGSLCHPGFHGAGPKSCFLKKTQSPAPPPADASTR